MKLPAIERFFSAVARLPVRFALLAVIIYQRAFSPVLPALFGPACGCRFYPTCSQYAADALRANGLLLGGLYATRRLLRCTPFHPGGFDPVPAPGAWQRICRRTPSSRVTT